MDHCDHLHIETAESACVVWGKSDPPALCLYPREGMACPWLSPCNSQESGQLRNIMFCFVLWFALLEKVKHTTQTLCFVTKHLLATSLWPRVKECQHREVIELEKPLLSQKQELRLENSDANDCY